MNDLTNEQLELIGIRDNAIWHKHKNDHGYIDGESFETFFHRKHGYKSDQHEIEKSKRNLSLEERIQKEQHEKLRVDGVFLTIFPWHHKNYKGWKLENGVLTSTDKSKGHSEGKWTTFRYN